MIIITTKVGARHPVNIEQENNFIDVVSELQLLRCMINEELRFVKHVKNLKSAVCRKLFIIKSKKKR